MHAALLSIGDVRSGESAPQAIPQPASMATISTQRSFIVSPSVRSSLGIQYSN
jgi:hypothetical protein